MPLCTVEPSTEAMALVDAALEASSLPHHTRPAVRAFCRSHLAATADVIALVELVVAIGPQPERRTVSAGAYSSIQRPRPRGRTS